MATDDSTRPSRLQHAVGGTMSTVFRIALDLFVVTCWATFLTLLFLEVGWSRWAFHALLLGGVGVYVLVTASWRRSDDSLP